MFLRHLFSVLAVLLALGAVSDALICPMGKYLYLSNPLPFGSYSCLNCPAGTYQSNPALNTVGIDKCLSCSAGFFSGEASAKCTPCANGES
jgi:hypothetical protein